MSEMHPEEVPESAADVVCRGGFRLPSLGMGNAPVAGVKDQAQWGADYMKETYGDE